MPSSLCFERTNIREREKFPIDRFFRVFFLLFFELFKIAPDARNQIGTMLNQRMLRSAR